MNNESLTSKVSEDMFENYIAVQKQFLETLDEKDKDVANRFVYHQYVSIIMKYLKKIASKRIKAKDVYPILNNYLNHNLIQDSFKSYKPLNKKDSFIHHCIKQKFYFPIVMYLWLKS